MPNVPATTSPSRNFLRKIADDFRFVLALDIICQYVVTAIILLVSNVNATAVDKTIAIIDSAISS